MGQCSSFKDELSQTVALAFQLVFEEGVKKSQRNIIKAIETKEFQTTFKKALEDEAKAFLKAQKKDLKLDSRFVLRNTMKKSSTALVTEFSNQLKKSPEYAKIKSSLKKLECAFDKTSVGIFVDKNKTWLIIVGVVGGLGGTVGLYYARSGDLLAGQLLPRLSEYALKKREIANTGISIGASLTKFIPSTRELSFKAIIALEWEKIEASLNISGDFKGSEVIQATSTVKITVPLKKNIKFSANASLCYKRQTVKPGTNCGKTFGVTDQTTKLELGLVLDYKVNRYTNINIYYKQERNYFAEKRDKAMHIVGIGATLTY